MPEPSSLVLAVIAMATFAGFWISRRKSRVGSRCAVESSQPLILEFDSGRVFPPVWRLPAQIVRGSGIAWVGVWFDQGLL